jgi:hypothetical protein
MSFEDALNEWFPTHSPEEQFIEETYRVLNRSGFEPGNTITAVDVCRDEISQPVVSLIKKRWRETFNLSGLAGMFFAGKTALRAIMHHVPIGYGKERHVYIALTHMAIGPDGEMGLCRRIGREEPSHACGALATFQGELAGGRLNLAMDNEDMEYSLLKMRLISEIPYGHVPDLLELTRITYDVIRLELEKSLEEVLDPSRSHYALITGIQIHGPSENYIWPGECYRMDEGIKVPIELDGV